jgi:hypothetical protein
MLPRVWNSQGWLYHTIRPSDLTWSPLVLFDFPCVQEWRLSLDSAHVLLRLTWTSNTCVTRTPSVVPHNPTSKSFAPYEILLDPTYGVNICEFEGSTESRYYSSYSIRGSKVKEEVSYMKLFRPFEWGSVRSTRLDSRSYLIDKPGGKGASFA